MTEKSKTPWYFHPLLSILLAILLDGLIEAVFFIIWQHQNPSTTIPEEILHLSSALGKICGAIFLFGYYRLTKKFA